ncbi:MAG: hypothetical protein AAF357_18445, partial [Verrucomicrobiota bacterium]
MPVLDSLDISVGRATQITALAVGLGSIGFVAGTAVRALLVVLVGVISIVAIGQLWNLPSISRVLGFLEWGQSPKPSLNSPKEQIQILFLVSLIICALCVGGHFALRRHGRPANQKRFWAFVPLSVFFLIYSAATIQSWVFPTPAKTDRSLDIVSLTTLDLTRTTSKLYASSDLPPEIHWDFSPAFTHSAQDYDLDVSGFATIESEQDSAPLKATQDPTVWGDFAELLEWRRVSEEFSDTLILGRRPSPTVLSFQTPPLAQTPSQMDRIRGHAHLATSALSRRPPASIPISKDPQMSPFGSLGSATANLVWYRYDRNEAEVLVRFQATRSSLQSPTHYEPRRLFAIHHPTLSFLIPLSRPKAESSLRGSQSAAEVREMRFTIQMDNRIPNLFHFPRGELQLVVFESDFEGYHAQTISSEDVSHSGTEAGRSIQHYSMPAGFEKANADEAVATLRRTDSSETEVREALRQIILTRIPSAEVDIADAHRPLILKIAAELPWLATRLSSYWRQDERQDLIAHFLSTEPISPDIANWIGNTSWDNRNRQLLLDYIKRASSPPTILLDL